MGVPFPHAVKGKSNETGVLSWIVFKSRAHHDRVNARVMKDARPAEMMEPKLMPFDVKRMVYGGFRIIIDVRPPVRNPGDALPILSRMRCGVPGILSKLAYEACARTSHRTACRVQAMSWSGMAVLDASVSRSPFRRRGRELLHHLCRDLRRNRNAE